MPYWHYQLVLSWYPYQPEPVKSAKGLGVTDRRTSGPKDRTPGSLGSDKNITTSYTHLVQEKYNNENKKYFKNITKSHTLLMQERNNNE